MNPFIKLDQVLEVFERLSIDEQAYFSLKNDEDKLVSFQFVRNASRSWSIWLAINKDASKQTCSRAHFPKSLSAFKVTETKVVQHLTSLLLTQAAYADEFIRQVTELLGAEAVKNSIRDTQYFMLELEKAVTQVFEKKPVNTQEAVAEEPIVTVEKPKTSAPRLRIVHND